MKKTFYRENPDGTREEISSSEYWKMVFKHMPFFVLGIVGGLLTFIFSVRAIAYYTQIPWPVVAILFLCIFGTATFYEHKKENNVRERKWPIPSLPPIAKKILYWIVIVIMYWHLKTVENWSIWQMLILATFPHLWQIKKLIKP